MPFFNCHYIKPIFNFDGLIQFLMLSSPWSQHYRRAIHRSSLFSVKVCLAAFHCRFHLQGWDPWCLFFFGALRGKQQEVVEWNWMRKWAVGQFHLRCTGGLEWTRNKSGHLTNTRRGFDQHKMWSLYKTGNYMSTYWWENPDKGWLWSMIFPWNVAGAPVEPAPTTNEELTHGTKPAPSFTHWRDYHWWLDLLLYPMSLIFIGPVCQSPSMNFCPVQLAIWGNLGTPRHERHPQSDGRFPLFSQAFSPDVPLDWATRVQS